MAPLLNDLLAHLISEGVVRDPRVRNDLPPAWRDPRNGTPAPGEGRNAVEIGPDVVIGLFFAGGITTPRFDQARRRDIVDVVIRARRADVAVDIGNEVRRVTINRIQWQMGSRTCIESLEWRPLQPLPPRTDGHTFLYGLLLETYAYPE